MDLDEIKRGLRKSVRERMPPPGSDAFIAASLAAQERLASWLLRHDESVRMVGLYRALPSECGTLELSRILTEMGREVCYPIIDPERRELRFRRGDGGFAPGALGIEEPLGERFVDLQHLQVLVVPALAVDAKGRRLGRGRGHYDATLALCPCPSVALVFDSQLVPEVPVGEHDRPVDAVCTDLRLIERST